MGLVPSKFLFSYEMSDGRDDWLRYAVATQQHNPSSSIIPEGIRSFAVASDRGSGFKDQRDMSGEMMCIVNLSINP